MSASPGVLYYIKHVLRSFWNMLTLHLQLTLGMNNIYCKLTFVTQGSFRCCLSMYKQSRWQSFGGKIHQDHTKGNGGRTRGNFHHERSAPLQVATVRWRFWNTEADDSHPRNVSRPTSVFERVTCYHGYRGVDKITRGQWMSTFWKKK